LTVILNIPGDNPDTAVVEPNFTLPEHTLINFGDDTVTRDVDHDDDFTNNPHVGDPDNDGVGENERDRFREFDDRERDDAEEIGIAGTIQSIDFPAATITLSGIANNGEHTAQFEGPFDQFTFEFTELTEFVIRTDAAPDGIAANASMFSAGDSVEMDIYPALTGGYWVENVKRDDRSHGGGGKGGGGRG
jgi:hypothetical protein